MRYNDYVIKLIESLKNKNYAKGNILFARKSNRNIYCAALSKPVFLNR
jgi:hypothetical protein